MKMCVRIILLKGETKHYNYMILITFINSEIISWLHFCDTLNRWTTLTNIISATKKKQEKQLNRGSFTIYCTLLKIEMSFEEENALSVAPI